MAQAEPSPSSSNPPDTAGVVVRPPFLFLGTLGVGAGVDRQLPSLNEALAVPPLFSGTVGAVLAVIGLAFATMGIRNFSRAQTPVPTWQPTISLVKTGIHGRTRNPIYLGMFLMYGGIGIALESASTLLLLPALAAVMWFGVVAREEAYLERRFGAVYLDYKARVNRWCPSL